MSYFSGVTSGPDKELPVDYNACSKTNRSSKADEIFHVLTCSEPFFSQRTSAGYFLKIYRAVEQV